MNKTRSGFGWTVRRLIALVLALAILVSSAVPAGASAPTTHAVSPAGQALYEYEALLHQTLKPTGDFLEVCENASACHLGWFYKQLPLPEADTETYAFVFSHFGPSSFHLMPSWFQLQANAYPGPAGYAPGTYIPKAVTVNGRYVACDPSRNVFLVQYLDATGAGRMGCLAPATAGNATQPYKLPQPRQVVSAAGQLLFEYEEVIRALFGPDVLYCQGMEPVSASACRVGWFYPESRVKGGALSYQLFTFAFSGLGASPLHLMPPWFKLAPGSLGNYPVPVIINGRYVACNGAGTVFLINYGDVDGAGGLACLEPQP